VRPPAGGARKRPINLREWALLAFCIVLLLGATLPPLLNLGRYQKRIAGAISRSIGRPVSVDSIRVQLLPWPAFRLQNLTVGEDPGFGAEPALRAPEVIVEPSLGSLWRGRFEISKVEISDASVNLVRNADRRWNISSVLLQASHVQNAPTGKAHAGQPPRFPYIEATGTRINIKRGLEKLPYSLLNADFSMWLADPGTWEIRLEGQPARTDLEATSGDTGDIRLDGEIHRASELGGMPVSLTGEWTQAPLGQAGRLLLGREVGWRGQVDLRAHFTGQIDALAIHAHLGIANLHRQEFTPEETIGVDATCTGHYSRALPASDAFRCRWPVGDGRLSLASGAVTADAPRSFTLGIEKVAASFPIRALGLLRVGLPSPESFTGTVDGSLAYDLTTRQWSGSVKVPTLQIANAAADGSALTVREIELSAQDNTPSALQVTSAPVPLGVAQEPLELSAVLGPHGYTLTANGGLTLGALHAAASALRLPRLGQFSEAPNEGAPSGVAPQGVATVKLAVTTEGPWMNPESSDGPKTHATGTLQLAHVLWQPVWMPEPIEMGVVNAIFAPESIRWNVPEATPGMNAGGKYPAAFAINAEQPLFCAPGTACPLQFSISTTTLSTEEIASVFAGRQNALLSAVLARFDPTRLHLPALHGSIHAGVFTLGLLPIRNASALIATGPGAGGAQLLRVESLDGRALGGSLHLVGDISAMGSGPTYRVQATLSGASAAKTAALWHEDWGGGTLGGTADLTVSGSNPGDLLHSASGRFQASWQGGSLGKVLPHFASWDALGTLSGSGLLLTRSALSGTTTTVSGTIGWNRSLDLQLMPALGGTPGSAYGSASGSGSAAITGTLDKPVAVAAAKPAP
jgi:hypothetical protein